MMVIYNSSKSAYQAIITICLNIFNIGHINVEMEFAQFNLQTTQYVWFAFIYVNPR